MLYLYKLSINGVRSYLPNSTESLTFSPYLTIIYGPLGSGKTSLCESIKFLITGQIPENFYTNPEYLKNDVYSYIKLEFSSFEQNYKASRHIKIDYNNSKIENIEQRIKSPSSNDMLSVDIFLNKMKGFFKHSEFYLNYVCFCNQEDFCWVFQKPQEFSKLMQELCENCDYEIFGKNLMKILYVNESNLVKLRQEEDKTAKEFFQYIKRKQEVLNEIIEAKAQMDCNIGHYKDLLNKLQEKKQLLQRNTESFKVSERIYKEKLAKRDQLKKNLLLMSFDEAHKEKSIDFLLEERKIMVSNISKFEDEISKLKKESTDLEKDLNDLNEILNDLKKKQDNFNKLESAMKKCMNEINFIGSNIDIINQINTNECTFKEFLQKQNEIFSMKEQEYTLMKAKYIEKDVLFKGITTELKAKTMLFDKSKELFDKKTKDLNLQNLNFAKLNQKLSNPKDYDQILQNIDSSTEIFSNNIKNIDAKLIALKIQRDCNKDNIYIQDELLKMKSVNHGYRQLRIDLAENQRRLQILLEEIKVLSLNPDHHQEDYQAIEKENSLLYEHIKEKEKIMIFINEEIKNLEFFERFQRKIIVEYEIILENPAILNDEENRNYEEIVREIKEIQESLVLKEKFPMIFDGLFESIMNKSEKNKECAFCKQKYDEKTVIEQMKNSIDNFKKRLNQDDNGNLKKKLESLLKKKQYFEQKKRVFEEFQQIKKKYLDILTVIAKIENDIQNFNRKRKNHEIEIEGIRKLITINTRKLDVIRNFQDFMNEIHRETQEFQDYISNHSVLQSFHLSVNECLALEVKSLPTNTSITSKMDELNYKKIDLNSKIKSNLNEKNEIINKRDNFHKDSESKKKLELDIIKNEEDVKKTENEVNNLKNELAILQQKSNELSEIITKLKENKFFHSGYANNIRTYQMKLNEYKNILTDYNSLLEDINDIGFKRNQTEEKIKDISENHDNKKKLLVTYEGKMAQNIENIINHENSMNFIKLTNELNEVEETLIYYKSDIDCKSTEISEMKKEIKNEEKEVKKANELEENYKKLIKEHDEFRENGQKIEENYVQNNMKLQTMEAIISDIKLSLQVLSKTLLEYKEKKIKELNIVLNNLYKKVLHSDDMLYLEIKSDSNGNYHVHLISNEGISAKMNNTSSFGQKSLISLLIRLTIIMTISPEFPKIIILDEPFLGFSYKEINPLIEEMKLIQKNIQIIIMTGNKEIFKSIRGSFEEKLYEIEKIGESGSKINLKSFS